MPRAAISQELSKTVKHLDFLPGPLNGFAAYTNYTHVHSDATLPRGASILPGQASNMGNASLSYEKAGFSSRVSFNRQGRYILAIGGDSASDNWLDHRTEIDFSASQSINKHMRLFIDMLNLGNQPYRVYVGDSSHFIQEERYKMWAILGLKLDF